MLKEFVLQKVPFSNFGLLHDPLIHTSADVSRRYLFHIRKNKEDIPARMECLIYRSDQIQPITVREHFSELQTEHAVWQPL